MQGLSHRCCLFKVRSHCGGNDNINKFWVSLPNRFDVEWVQYPFKTAMAVEKMGIMATSCGVHIVMATAMEKELSCSVHSVAVDATV